MREPVAAAAPLTKTLHPRSVTHDLLTNLNVGAAASSLDRRSSPPPHPVQFSTASK